MARDGITVATNIAFTKAELSKYNNISYLYNPNWNPEGDARVGHNTLPMTLLFITKLQEVAQSAVSSQQMILYKGDDTGTDTSKIAQAQLNVVADNIVNQPRQYQVEAILPATYDSLINGPFSPKDPTGDPYFLAMKNEDYKTKKNLIGTDSEGVLNDSEGKVSKTIDILGNAVNSSVLGTLRNITSLLSMGNTAFRGGSFVDYITGVFQNGGSYNKDSLFAMWYSRGILKFKPPMEWAYKTVAIINCNVTKNPTEDRCFRLSLTLQEVPISTIGYFDATKTQAKPVNSVYARSLGKALSASLKTACTDYGY